MNDKGPALTMSGGLGRVEHLPALWVADALRSGSTLVHAMDLTPHLVRYRECARHVWNVFFQPMADGWHEFMNVQTALFSGMVLAQFERRHGLYEKHPDGYFDAIAVTFAPEPSGVAAMYVNPEAGKPSQWLETRIENAPIEARLVEFFDFANYTDTHDLRWVRARIVGPAGHRLLGADVLVEFENVRFEGLTC